MGEMSTRDKGQHFLLALRDSVQNFDFMFRPLHFCHVTKRSAALQYFCVQ